MINKYATNYGDDTNIIRRAGPASNIRGTFEKTGKSNKTDSQQAHFLLFLAKIYQQI